jgi:hypothetical protein
VAAKTLAGFNPRAADAGEVRVVIPLIDEGADSVGELAD